jgi:hypothetical protein
LVLLPVAWLVTMKPTRLRLQSPPHKPGARPNSRMPLLAPTRLRRELTIFARVRRRIQKLRPYQSLALLLVPICLVEPLKIVALFVAGEGHWVSSTAILVGAYVVSLLITERLFRAVKPKLMTLGWFATLWAWVVTLPRKLLAVVRLR